MTEIKIPLREYLDDCWVSLKIKTEIMKDTKLTTALWKHLKHNTEHKDTAVIIEKFVISYRKKFGVYNNITRKYEK